MSSRFEIEDEFSRVKNQIVSILSQFERKICDNGDLSRTCSQISVNADADGSCGNKKNPQPQSKISIISGEKTEQRKSDHLSLAENYHSKHRHEVQGGSNEVSELKQAPYGSDFFHSTPEKPLIDQEIHQRNSGKLVSALEVRIHSDSNSTDGKYKYSTVTGDGCAPKAENAILACKSNSSASKENHVLEECYSKSSDGKSHLNFGKDRHNQKVFPADGGTNDHRNTKESKGAVGHGVWEGKEAAYIDGKGVQKESFSLSPSLETETKIKGAYDATSKRLNNQAVTQSPNGSQKRSNEEAIFTKKNEDYENGSQHSNLMKYNAQIKPSLGAETKEDNRGSDQEKRDRVPDLKTSLAMRNQLNSNTGFLQSKDANANEYDMRMKGTVRALQKLTAMKENIRAGHLMDEMNDLAKEKVDNREERYFYISIDSAVVHYWEMLIALAIVHVVIFIPLQLAFEDFGALYFLDIINCCLDFLFILDVAINFRTSFRDENTREEVRNAKKIASHYLKGSFSTDALASFPYQSILFIVAASGSRDLSQIDSFKILHFLRLTKATRLKHSLKFIESKGSNPAVIRMVWLLLLFFLIVHLVACCYHGFFVNEGQTEDFTGEYGISLYFSLAMLQGNTFDASSPLEYYFQMVCFLVGIVMNATVIGSATTLMESIDASSVARKKHIDGVVEFMRLHKIPRQLQKKVRGYFEYLWDIGLATHNTTLMEELPPNLKFEINLTLKRYLLEDCPLVRTLKGPQLMFLIKNMKTIIALPDDLILKQGEKVDSMYILCRGAVDVFLNQGRPPDQYVITLHKGSVFGSYGLMNVKRTSNLTYIAEGFCELLTLKKKHFDQLFKTNFQFKKLTLQLNKATEYLAPQTDDAQNNNDKNMRAQRVIQQDKQHRRHDYLMSTARDLLHGVDTQAADSSRRNSRSPGADFSRRNSRGPGADLSRRNSRRLWGFQRNESKSMIWEGNTAKRGANGLNHTYQPEEIESDEILFGTGGATISRKESYGFGRVAGIARRLTLTEQRKGSNSFHWGTSGTLVARKESNGYSQSARRESKSLLRGTMGKESKVNTARRYYTPQDHQFSLARAERANDSLSRNPSSLNSSVISM